MSSGTSIDLVQPIAWFDKQITRLLLKAPTGMHFLKFGEPRFLVRMADGAGYFVEKDDVIKQYIMALLAYEAGDAVDGGDHILNALSLADVIQIRGALFDFFTDAQSAISRKSLTP